MSWKGFCSNVSRVASFPQRHPASAQNQHGAKMAARRRSPVHTAARHSCPVPSSHNTDLTAELWAGDTAMTSRKPTLRK
ncbi:unnamed protein product [Lota lota]